MKWVHYPKIVILRSSSQSYLACISVRENQNLVAIQSSRTCLTTDSIQARHESCKVIFQTSRKLMVFKYQPSHWLINGYHSVFELANGSRTVFCCKLFPRHSSSPFFPANFLASIRREPKSHSSSVKEPSLTMTFTIRTALFVPSSLPFTPYFTGKVMSMTLLFHPLYMVLLITCNIMFRKRFLIKRWSTLETAH